jgi:hypothetical protein
MSQDIYNAAKSGLISKGVDPKDAEAAAQVVASDKAGRERTPEQQAAVTKAWSQIQ